MAEVDLGPVLSPDDKVQFVDAHRPALRDGDYTVRVTQNLKEHTFFATREIKFSVSGPRFSLPQTDVQSCFPPATASGDFSAVLPHIILERATLPWERTALPHGHGVDNDHLPPWVALLVFTDDEIEKHTKIVPVSELTDPGRHAGWTPLPAETTDDPAAQAFVLDLPGHLAQSILPTVGELELLTSVRVVNDTRSRAIVVGNRLCKPGARHIAHLVSLEGQYRPISSAARGAPVAQSFKHWAHGSGHNVRLVSLAQWTFHCDESHGDFHQILSSVTPAHLALSGADTGVARHAVGAGAIPLHHRRATGELTPSWYHGPLAVTRHPVQLDVPARHADELLLNDRTTGMVDISYAAAWQLGRLLALSDPQVGPPLYQWKRRMQHLAHADSDVDDNPALNDHKVAPAPPFPLTKWFDSALGLLAAVPFDYLVPEPDVLPPESIAFFGLDTAWIRALYDGAFSIGRTGQRQQMLDAMTQAHLPQSGVEDAPAFPTRSGLLLRSRCVDGWPDLIVDGFDASGSPLGAPVRFERLGKQVLLVIFDGLIGRAEIHLHPQAMHFGFDGTPSTGLTKPRVKARSSAPAKVRLRPKSRVLDLYDTQLNGFAKDIGADTPHDFAMAMIEGVPRVIFKTELFDV